MEEKRRVILAVDISEIDVLDIKVINDGMVGTLHIEKQGLGFSPPNTKKVPESRCGWNHLLNLIAFGNGKG